MVMSSEEFRRNSLSALPYQPERKLMKKTMASPATMGRAMENFFKKSFFRWRCSDQYCKNFSSSGVSIKKIPSRFRRDGKRGTEQIRTAVGAFAELCLATRPRYQKKK